MRKVIASTYMTLDGRMDDLQEWTAPHDSEAVARFHDDVLADCDGLILGRRTYEVFAVIWPARAGRLAYGDKINELPKYVASGTLTNLEWENSHLIDEYRILLHPVLLGKGRSFFADAGPRVDLELVDSAVISRGVTVLTYRPVR